jgi:hypothetical protein
LKKIIKNFLGAIVTVTVLTAHVSAAEYLLANPSFEEPYDGDTGEPLGSTDGWGIVGIAEVSAPAVAGAQDGNFAVRLSNNSPGFDVGFIFQRGFPASPGDEFYGSAHILTEVPLVDGPSARFMKLQFYDSNSLEIAPKSISKGRLDPCRFPGTVALPAVDASTGIDEWILQQAQQIGGNQNEVLIDCEGFTGDGGLPVQAIAPPGTVEVGIFLFNINFTGSAAPIWYDNAILARLDPDDDGDRLENGVDSDPLNQSTDFSDGTTSGTVIQDANEILGVDDEPGSDGVRITTSPGPGSPARVSVCDGSATLSIRPDTDVVITCGSVILVVEDGPAVTMEIDIDGETATVEVPPGNTVTFEPDTDTLEVDSAANDPEPVILTIGGTDIEIEPGETVELTSIQIDIKPGSSPNCININSKGVIPVAILGSESLDVANIDQASLDFGGLEVRERGNGRHSCGVEDVNSDGFSDLVCHFEDDESSWISDGTSATLSGMLLDETVVSGTDAICLVP